MNRAVKRNIERFPVDFMIQLSKNEWENLKCQIGTSSWGGKRKLPNAFTEHGAIMLASVLNSERADMGVFVCFAQQVTDGMRKLARDAGYIPDFKVDRLQIVTVEDLLEGKSVRLPGLGEMLTFKSATKRLDGEKEMEGLF